jgi:hypothetical protein
MKYSALLPMLLGLWCANIETVHAAPEASATAEASAHFRKGVQLYKSRSFDAALAEFEKSYQIAPDFHVLYNVAQVQLERHDYVAALRRFREYLQLGAAEVSASRRSEVEQEIARLTELVAEVRFAVVPEGAEVWVDGVSVGLLPLSTPLLVNGGVHRLQLSKAGFTTVQQTLTVAGGDTPRIAITLQALPANPPAAATQPAAPPPGPSRALQPTAPTAEPAARSRRSNTGMWLTLGTTVAFGGAAGAMAILTRRTNDDFGKDLDTFGTPRSTLDSQRSKLKTYAILTDAFTGAALLSAGLCVYFIASGDGASEKRSAVSHVALTTDLRGVYARGDF